MEFIIGNGANAITAVDMSTKGSIIVGDGSGNPQTLSVGTNGYALVADSSTTTGLAWTTLTSGTITGVTAGIGLSGGGTSGGVTLTLDMSELTDMTADVVGSQDELILLDNGEIAETYFWR